MFPPAFASPASVTADYSILILGSIGFRELLVIAVAYPCLQASTNISYILTCSLWGKRRIPISISLVLFTIYHLHLHANSPARHYRLVGCSLEHTRSCQEPSQPFLEAALPRAN